MMSPNPAPAETNALKEGDHVKDRTSSDARPPKVRYRQCRTLSGRYHIKNQHQIPERYRDDDRFKMGFRSPIHRSDSSSLKLGGGQD